MSPLTTQFVTVLFVVGALVLFLGLVSDLLKRVGIPATLLAVGVGILAGPAVFGGFTDPAGWTNRAEILKNVSRVALSVSLMSAALRLPHRYMRRHWRAAGIMLGPVMLLMWAGATLLVWLILRFSLLKAALIGAILTPTDPVVAASIISGRFATQHVPTRVRHVLTVEAGANDGLAYLFVLLPLLLLTQSGNQPWQTWLLDVLFRQVLLAILLGAIIGAAAGWSLRRAIDRHAIEKPAFLATSLALALVTLGAVRLIGSDGILAVFVAGLTFKPWLTEKEKGQAERPLKLAEPFLTLPVFALIGLLLPYGEWLALGWQGLLLVAAVLLLRRLPAVLLMAPALREVHTRLGTLFVGWFGPIGVGALFYSSLTLERGHFPEVWPVASLIIIGSIVAHGLTATPFSRLLRKGTENRESRTDGTQSTADGGRQPQAAGQADLRGRGDG